MTRFNMFVIVSFPLENSFKILMWEHVIYFFQNQNYTYTVMWKLNSVLTTNWKAGKWLIVPQIMWISKKTWYSVVILLIKYLRVQYAIGLGT